MAGDDASLSSAGNLQADVTAVVGSIDASSMGTTQLTASASGDITVKSFGQVSSASLTSDNGDVDVEVFDDATLTVQAANDIELFASGNLDGTIAATNGSINADALGTLKGTYTAGADATVDALGDASGGTAVSATDNAELTTVGNADGVTVSGGLSANVWAGGTLSGTVSSSSGDASTYSLGDSNVTVSAAGGVSIEGLANVEANVTSGGSSTVFAFGGLSGSVRSSADATLLCGGDMDVSVTADGDAAAAAIGNLTATISAGHDITAGAFGDVDATSFDAGNDVVIVWARGGISGDISADESINEVDSYSGVNANLTAPTVGTVAAYGTVGGSITASTSVGGVESGATITASINSPNVGGFVQHDVGLLSDWPPTPVLSDGADVAAREEMESDLAGQAEEIAANKQGSLSQMQADKTAAAPGFAVSIGSLSAAEAAFQEDGENLDEVIAANQDQAQQLLVGANKSLGTFFLLEDARLAVAKSGAKEFVSSVSGTLAQISADRLEAAAEDKAAAKEILAEESKDRAKYLEKLDHIRDVDWPTLFEDRLRARLLDRLQTVLDVAGILDPTPLSDGTNALISALRGKTSDALISGAGALVPYLGDLAKFMKLGKFADDALEGARRVAGDYIGLAGKSLRFLGDACDSATMLGRINKALGYSISIGCFDAETEIEMSDLASPSMQAGSGIEWVAMDEPSDHRWLWASLIVGAAFAGHWAANRRLRREEDDCAAKEAAILGLFAPKVEIDDHVDDLTLLAYARHQPARELVSAAARAAHAAPECLDEPLIADAFNDGAELPVSAVIYGNQRHLRYDRTDRVAETRMKHFVQIPPVAHSRQRPNRGRRRQSRFGLTWVGVLLTFAAFVAFGPRPSSHPAARELSSLPATVPSAIDRVAPRTKRIADVVVGDRVKSENPTGDEDLSLGVEVEPATWRKLVLRASKNDGGWADVELLRPLSWLDERGARIGGTAPISVPECGISGDADVVAIEPCPPIAPGKGRVVTGTFHHSSVHVLDLQVQGLASPIVTTVNHLFWSADREAYVRADALRSGEHLQGRDGLVSVMSATPRHDSIPVYNLEVQVDHVYHVSPAGIVVHNGTDDCWRLATAITGTKARKLLAESLGASDLPAEAAAQAHHIFPVTLFDTDLGRQLRAWGIDLNSKDNGVWLPSRWYEGIKESIHSGRTSADYIATVETALKEARDKEEALRILESLRQRLLTGDLPINAATGK